VIGIGGALLGGSGKTPVAIALARGLAAKCARVALIGHGYRAHPERPHIVHPSEPLIHAGDDALCAARLLAPDGIAVIVGPTRQAAAEYAAAEGFTTLVLDGLLQATPRRLDAAILVLDAAAPWGSGACPPLGDLRAPREALLAAADHVAAIAVDGEVPGDPDAIPSAAIRVGSSLNGAVDACGKRIPLSDLAQGQTGVLLAIARPERITSMLARYGIHPSAVIALADHTTPDAKTRERASAARVDCWLTTARCATKLPAEIGGRPVLWLDHAIDAGALVERMPTAKSWFVPYVAHYST
jgi:tetraacyldisaccharide 4'-kinase